MAASISARTASRPLDDEQRHRLPRERRAQAGAAVGDLQRGRFADGRELAGASKLLVLLRRRRLSRVELLPERVGVAVVLVDAVLRDSRGLSVVAAAGDAAQLQLDLRLRPGDVVVV